MNCPICEQELTYLTRPNTKGSQHLFCETCKVEFYVYPPDNKDALQRTGWYAHIPLKNFPREAWEELIHTERNFYGEEMPDRMPSIAHPFIKDDEEAIRVGKEMAAKQREAARKEIEEWEKRVG